MNSKEDTRFIPLVSILLLSGTLAFVLGGFRFRLAAFGVTLLGLIGSYLYLWCTEKEYDSEACNDTSRPGPGDSTRAASGNPKHTQRPSAQRAGGAR